MKNELVEISKYIIDNINNIDDRVDNYFEPIKDLTDTAGDLFTPIKIFNSLYTFNKKRKFKNFIKYYAKSLSEHGITNLNDSEILKTYLSDEKNFNFVHETIQNAIDSKSIYGSMLLGYFAGNILADTQIITLRELIIIEGIKELNDYELSWFTRIYSVVNLAKEIDIKDYKKELHSTYLCEVTISKLLNLRIADEPLNRHDSNRKGRFNSNEMGEKIFYLIDAIGIKEDLLNYY